MGRDAGARGATRTAIVTGATSGIGKEVARKLAELGFEVVLACRHLEAAQRVKEELDASISGARVAVGPRLDLSSNAAIKAFVDAFGERPVSLLVNNAGGNHPSDHFSNDGIPLTAQVEHLIYGHQFLNGSVDYVGPYLLTRLLTPNLQRSPVRARVVNVTSVMHRFGHVVSSETLLSEGMEGKYADSKLALVMFSQEFQRRFGETIDCCSVDPGGVNTKIFDTTVFGKGVCKWMIQSCYAPPEDAALVVMHAAQCNVGMDEGSPFYARGTFAFSAVTGYRGYTPDLLGRCLHVAVLLMCMVLSLCDYSLRRNFDRAVFHEVYAVPPLSAAFDVVKCQELWKATEKRIERYL